MFNLPNPIGILPNAEQTPIKEIPTWMIKDPTIKIVSNSESIQFSDPLQLLSDITDTKLQIQYPNQQNPVPFDVDTEAKQIVRFVFETEAFINLKDLYICFDISLNLLGIDNLNINLNQMLQPPYVFAQLISKFECKINGRLINESKDQFTLMDSILHRITKEEKWDVEQIGVPYQKITNNRLLGAERIISSIYDTNFEDPVQLWTSTDQEFTKQIRVPFWMFMNLFGRDKWFPAATRFELLFEFNRFEWPIFESFSAGAVYQSPLPAFPDPPINMKVSNIKNIQINYKRYTFSNGKQEEFYAAWKQMPILYNYFHLDLENMNLLTNGSTTKYALQVTYMDEIPTALAIGVRPRYDTSTRSILSLSNPENLFIAPNYFVAYPPPNNNSFVMQWVPFFLSQLVLNKDGRIIKDYSQVRYEMIIQDLQNQSDKIEKSNKSNQMQFDWYSTNKTRASLLFIPLNEQDKITSTITQVPEIKRNLTIEFNIQTILNQPLPAGYEICLYKLNRRQLKMSITREVEIYNSPSVWSQQDNSLVIPTNIVQY